MPRVPRSALDGECCHVLNRGNARRAVFLKSGDYESFLKAMAHACIEVPFGSEPWVEAAVRKYGLESTIRRRGRPSKERAEPRET